MTAAWERGTRFDRVDTPLSHHMRGLIRASSGLAVGSYGVDAPCDGIDVPRWRVEVM